MCKNYVTNSYYACCLIFEKKLLQEVEVQILLDINLQNIKISIVTEAFLKKIGKEEQDDLWYLSSIFIRDGTVCQLTSFFLSNLYGRRSIPGAHIQQRMGSSAYDEPTCVYRNHFHMYMADSCIHTRNTCYALGLLPFFPHYESIQKHEL